MGSAARDLELFGGRVAAAALIAAFVLTTPVEELSAQSETLEPVGEGAFRGVIVGDELEQTLTIETLPSGSDAAPMAVLHVVGPTDRPGQPTIDWRSEPFPFCTSGDCHWSAPPRLVDLTGDGAADLFVQNWYTGMGDHWTNLVWVFDPTSGAFQPAYFRWQPEAVAGLGSTFEPLSDPPAYGAAPCDRCTRALWQASTDGALISSQWSVFGKYLSQVHLDDDAVGPFILAYDVEFGPAEGPSFEIWRITETTQYSEGFTSETGYIRTGEEQRRVVFEAGPAATMPAPKPSEQPTPPAWVAAQRRVAVTIDDLPVAGAGRLSAQERRAVVEGFCRVLSEQNVPATGFFNMSGHAEQPELLQMWRECGVQVGNHTWSHPRLQEVGIDSYLNDLNRGHEAIRDVVGSEPVIYFRYPFLAEGFDPAQRDRIRARLGELASPIAPVTIDTSDWLYARGYDDALRDGDADLASRYHQSWRWNLEESTEYAELLATQLFGHEPPQVLLIHGNRLNAEHLGEYLQWLTDRGYVFVTLSDALADPAYAEADTSLSPTGDSHWLRLRRSRSMDPGR